MRLKNALNDKLMDVRLRDKLLAEGKVSKAQVDDFLNSLEDDSEKCEFSDEGVGRRAATDEGQVH